MRTIPPALADGLLPRYRLGEVLAEGGQAVVLRARDVALDRDVAIKVLPRAAASAVGIARFLREIRVLADLPHPYIIPILDAGETAGVLWYAMPLVRGETLASVVARGAQPDDLVRRWGRELAEALAIAHGHGVIHRDVKPGNVHVVDGHALLADFGVAALHEATDPLTGPEEAIGTGRYMAPEQRAGGGDERADLFGLGATLYEASTGSRWNANAREWGRVPRALREPLRRALAADASARWASATEFASALAGARQVRWRPVAAGGAAVLLGVAVWGPLRPPPTTQAFRTDLAVVATTDDPLTRRLLQASVVRLEWFPPLHVAPWVTTTERLVPVWRAEGMVEWARGDAMATITLRNQAGNAVEVLHVAGDTADLPRWARDVAAAVVARIRPDQLHDFTTHVGGARVGAALRAYYAGREAFERQDWDAAEAGYRAALVIDPAFAQAQWGVMQARKWARRPFHAELAALAALADLPAPLGALVALQREADLGRRLAGLDSLATAWPGVPEVHLVRANELFHRGALVGRGEADGVAALAEAARRFPALDRPVIWDHVVWGAVRLGDERLAREALRARRVGLVGADPWGPLLRYAVESRFRPWLGSLLGVALRTFGGGARPRVADAHRLAVLFDLPSAQATLAAWLLAGAQDEASLVTAWSGVAVAELMQGRVGPALAALDSAATASPGDDELAIQQVEWSLLLPLLGMPVESSQRTQDMMTRLVDPPAAWSPARVAFLRGGVAAQHGDTTKVAQALEALRTAHGDTLAIAVLASWLPHPDGAGGARDALRRALTRDASDAVVRARGPVVRALAIARLAEMHLATGDTSGAERALAAHLNVDVRGWPVGAPQEGELDAAVSVASRDRRAAWWLAQGDTVTGCRLQRRVADLWRREVACRR